MLLVTDPEYSEAIVNALLPWLPYYNTKRNRTCGFKLTHRLSVYYRRHGKGDSSNCLRIKDLFFSKWFKVVLGPRAVMTAGGQPLLSPS